MKYPLEYLKPRQVQTAEGAVEGAVPRILQWGAAVLYRQAASCFPLSALPAGRESSLYILLGTVFMNSDIQQRVPAPRCREEDYTIQQQ